MKTLFIPISITVLFISVLFASCTSHKNTQASASPSTTTKTKKETAAVTPKKEQTSVIKTEAVEVPPVDIKNNFSTRFPQAENATWNKKTSTETATANTNYTVAFAEAGKKNWVTYSNNGQVIEERQEILADQLPQNIYNAIRINYPTYKVASATTYKSTVKEGSYAVMLKPLSKFDTNEIEVIFTENASLVE